MCIKSVKIGFNEHFMAININTLNGYKNTKQLTFFNFVKTKSNTLVTKVKIIHKITPKAMVYYLSLFFEIVSKKLLL